MKLFLDTADINAIKRLKSTGLLDGVTTNPSHLSKAGGNPLEKINEICALLPDGEISVEVTENEPEQVYHQALKIAKLHPNILVKIPCHAKFYPIIHRLVEENIKLNITLVFTLIQSIMMAKLGVHYVSPFIGRWEDIDVDGNLLLHELREAFDQYDYETGILAASLRQVRHIHEAITAGADAITLPPELFEKSIEHILTNQGIEKFNHDWKKLGITKFP